MQCQTKLFWINDLSNSLNYEKLSLTYTLNIYENFQTSGAKTFIPVCNLENQISPRDLDNKKNSS